MANAQFAAIIEVINKLETLKAKTFNPTFNASYELQAEEYEGAKDIAMKAKSIVDDFLQKMVCAAIDVVGINPDDDYLEALVCNDAIDDCFYEADKTAEDYMEGGAE
jgi:hypothetical protein